MNSKKFVFFAFFMVAVMCVFSIYMSVTSKGENGINGKNGLSSYELAMKNGVISRDMTEVQYLQSLYGKDGSSVTLETIYEAYLKESGKTKEEFTYTEFILSYYPEKIVSDSESVSMVENATQQALRTTVDICYSFSMDTPIIYGQYNGNNFIINSNYENTYVSVGVSAGSGVIYDYEDTDDDGEFDTAYIVTNYHVVYCDNYSNNNDYYIYYDAQNDAYFSGTYDESKVKTARASGGFFYQSYTYKYLESSDIDLAPIYTHFLEDYGVYLYGHQSKEYRISASFVGGSADNDIAVLKVTKNSTNSNNNLIFSDSYTAVTLGDSSKLNEGQSIVAVGNPLLADTSNVDSSSVSSYVESAENAYIDALCLTSTSGEISNLSEQCVFTSIIDSTKTNTMRLIRVSSAINAGNSGGGLYSTDGKLVGIVNGKIESSNYDNIGYAIPIDRVKNIVKQIILQCDDEDITTTRIKALTEKSIGLSVKNGNSNSKYDANSLTWELSYDIEVEMVSGICAAAGIQVGDIINYYVVDGQDYDTNQDNEVTNYLVVGDEKYDLAIDYNLGESLLAVNLNAKTLTFNITRVNSSIDENFDITINLNNSNFVEIA